MRKLIIPIHFIVIMTSIAINGYAVQPGERIINSLAMQFALIKPGRFMMGSPEDESGRYSGERYHSANLTNPFYMQTTEVTQAQWKALMGKNPSSHQRCGDTCPVEHISWEDAQEFIQKLNQKEGTDNYRLPTEAEWEYACLAGSTSAFTNGGITELQCGRDANLDAIGWYCGNSNNMIHPVARKMPNAWDCMICMAMSRSGARTGSASIPTMMPPIRKGPLQDPIGS